LKLELSDSLCNCLIDASSHELIPEPTAIEMIYQFNKLKPPKFEGGADPMVYDEWLRRMETYLRLWSALRGSRCT